LACLVGLKANERADLHGAQAARERCRPWWSPSGVAERDRFASLVSPGMVSRLVVEGRQVVKSLSLLLPLSPDMDAYSGPQELNGALRARVISVDGSGLALWQPMDGLTASEWM
jgi:hypothetical protein